jgi:dynein heavy chain
MAEMQDNERRLTQQIDDSNKKLERANKIIEGLSGEKSRWTETVHKLSNEYDLLIGNCLVAAGMVAYSGSFTAFFRDKMEKQWG